MRKGNALCAREKDMFTKSTPAHIVKERVNIRAENVQKWVCRECGKPYCTLVLDKDAGQKPNTCPLMGGDDLSGVKWRRFE